MTDIVREFDRYMGNAEAETGFFGDDPPGRMACEACGVTVLRENWSNHVLGKTHERRMAAASRAAWRDRQRELATERQADHEAIVALAWALAQRSEWGPHDSAEKRLFRPLAEAFLRDLRAHPKRAAAVAEALCPDPAIDVDRLATALWHASPDDDAERYAVMVAAEYAALGGHDDTPD